MQNDIHKLEELFVTYEQALFLKELDYNEPCFEYFDSKSKLTFNTNGNPISKDWVWFGNQCLPIDMTLAPLKDQVFKFFREKHNLVGIVKFGANDFTYYIYNGDAVGLCVKESLSYDGAYEQAENACIDMFISICKQEKKNE